MIALVLTALVATNLPPWVIPLPSGMPPPRARGATPEEGRLFWNTEPFAPLNFAERFASPFAPWNAPIRQPKPPRFPGRGGSFIQASAMPAHPNTSPAGCAHSRR